MNRFLVCIPRNVVLEWSNKKKGMFNGKCGTRGRKRKADEVWWENLVHVRPKRKAYEVLVGESGARET